MQDLVIEQLVRRYCSDRELEVDFSEVVDQQNFEGNNRGKGEKFFHPISLASPVLGAYL